MSLPVIPAIPSAIQHVADPTTAAQQLAIDTLGRLTAITNPTDGTRATYAAGIVGLAAAALATDIFTITGSATKLVRVLRLRLSGIKTTAGADVDVQLLLRSTADTGGTKTNPNAIPYDSTSAAATAVVAAYTANPTVGTLVNTTGLIAVDSLFVPLATAQGGQIVWDFGNRPGQAIILRGVAQQLCVNLNGVTVGGGAFDCSVEWSEE